MKLISFQIDRTRHHLNHSFISHRQHSPLPLPMALLPFVDPCPSLLGPIPTTSPVRCPSILRLPCCLVALQPNVPISKGRRLVSQRRASCTSPRIRNPLVCGIDPLACIL